MASTKHLGSSADQPPAYATLYGITYAISFDPDGALAEFQALSPDEKAKFAIGVAQSTSDPEVVRTLRVTSNDAAKAIAAIDTLFVELVAMLESLPYDKDRLVKDFEEIKQKYRNVVDDSRILAIESSIYAKKFDLVIVNYCADPNISIAERKIRIQDYIDDAEEIRVKAEVMKGRYGTLITDFERFVATFSSWGQEQEGDIDQRIKDLKNKLDELAKDIAKFDEVITIIWATFSATLGIAGILIALFPPAAPFIVAAGALVASLQLGALIGLYVAKAELQGSQRNIEAEIRDLEGELSRLKATRARLEAQGKVDLRIFSENILVLQNVWVLAEQDAKKIRTWLEEGANNAEYPEYMRARLERGVEAYAAMAQYLTDYANGIEGAQRSFK